jgi:glycosyltransferase involved in cell wall biosynthesis
LRLAFLIRALSCGGAERQLVLLARGLAARGHAVSVSVFYSGGEFDRDLANCGIKVNLLQKRGRWDFLPFLLRTRKVLRAEAADVIHGYMGTSNLLVSLLKFTLKPAKIVWGVRASDLDGSDYDWLHRLNTRVETLLSRTADLIISNSEAGKRHVLRIGYPADRVTVVPNGIDLKEFEINPQARERIRSAWGLTENDIAVGRVGSLDPLKDYPGFLRAAALALEIEPRLKFICVGGGTDAQADAFRHYGVELGLSERVVWTGFVRDMPTIYNGLDLLVSSSKRGEGFPNVLGEARACGLRCVATDVGDVRTVIGPEGSGLVVPHGDKEAMAEAIVQLARLKPNREETRRRIAERYSIELLVERTLAELRALVSSPSLTSQPFPDAFADCCSPSSRSDSD